MAAAVIGTCAGAAFSVVYFVINATSSVARTVDIEVVGIESALAVISAVLTLVGMVTACIGAAVGFTLGGAGWAAGWAVSVGVCWHANNSKRASAASTLDGFAITASR